MPEEIVRQVRSAGVVGAGGAGFPTHVKLSARCEIVVANGAECEPLLRVDQQLMACHADEVVGGVEASMRATGAERGVIALKGKYLKALAALEEALSRSSLPIELMLMESHYPAGDEQVLVYEATGRLVPEGGIPVDVGVVVNNVGTLIQIHRAVRGVPVTERTLTVGGAVREPKTVSAPLGTPVEDVVRAAGGAAVDSYAVIDGGPIMGLFSKGVVTKTTTGLIVLPEDHPLVRYKRKPVDVDVRHGMSCCDGCRYCTDYCFRYLLGHRLEPHRVMQAVAYQAPENIPIEVLAMAYLCCECGICGMFACPTGLSPDRINGRLKRILKARGIKPLHLRKEFGTHPYRDGRRVSVKKMSRRLGVLEYDRDAPLEPGRLSVPLVRIPLKQHVGAPCRPAVSVGRRVGVGDPIGEVPEGSVGAPLHASLDGVVTQITEEAIHVRAN